MALTGQISHSQTLALKLVCIASHRSAMKRQLLLVKSILMKKQGILNNRHRINPFGELIKQLMGKNQPKRCGAERCHPIRIHTIV